MVIFFSVLGDGWVGEWFPNPYSNKNWLGPQPTKAKEFYLRMDILGVLFWGSMKIRYMMRNQLESLIDQTVQYFKID